MWLIFNRLAWARRILQGCAALLLLVALPAFAGNLKDFGAKGDGRSDDTDAIRTWLEKLQPGERGYAPAGTYRFTSPITIATQRLSLAGDGPYQTVFEFDGPADAGNILSIGDGREQVKNWQISGLRITSNTRMKGGAGIRLHNVVRSDLSDVIVDGQDGSGNLWNGIWFDEVDQVVYRGLEARAQHAAVIVNGGRGRSPKAGLMLMQGKISLSGIGLHVAGAFGGLYVDQMDIIANRRNVVIDTEVTPEGNREIIFGATASIDTAKGGPAVTLADRLASSEAWLQFSGTWLATGVSHGLLIEPGAQWIVSYQGGTVFNFQGDGIRNLSDRARLIVSGTVIRNNRGAGISGKAAFERPVLAGNGNARP